MKFTIQKIAVLVLISASCFQSSAEMTSAQKADVANALNAFTEQSANGGSLTTRDTGFSTGKTI